MRKIIALVLAIVMIAAMSVTVFAVETQGPAQIEDKNNAAKQDTVDVYYNVSKGYLVTIPGDFVLTEGEGGVGSSTGNDTVSIDKAKINAGEVLKVTVSGGQTGLVKDYNWVLVDTNTVKADNLGYKIFLNGGTTDHAQGAVVVSYESAAAAFQQVSATMKLVTAPTNQAGDFKDTLTFAVSVEAKKA